MRSFDPLVRLVIACKVIDPLALNMGTGGDRRDPATIFGLAVGNVNPIEPFAAILGLGLSRRDGL